MTIDHQKYRQILEAMPDGLYILDRQLIVHYMNPAIVRMIEGFKLSPDLVGKKFTDVLPSAMDYMQDEIDRVYETRKPVNVEHTIDVGIKVITYETVRIPLFDGNGNVTGVLNSTHDITNHLEIRVHRSQVLAVSAAERNDVGASVAVAQQRSQRIHIWQLCIVASPEIYATIA